MTKGRKVTKLAFLRKAIEKAKAQGYIDKEGNRKYAKGVHTKFYKFGSVNLIQAYTQYFNVDKDTFINDVNEYVRKSKLDGHPVKGGYMIYLPGESASASGSVSQEKVNEGIESILS